VDITGNDKAYASVAITHKEPTRNDFEDNVGANLKAEQLTDYEIGYKHNGTVFSAGANFYYMYYKNQFVLTGQLNEIGEMIASNDNSGRSYRTGIELEAAYKPVDWFRWDANATFSRNRNKHYTVTFTDPDTWESSKPYDMGSTPTSFSPDVIANNIFTFSKKGFNASIVTHFIGKQYLTNTGIDNYIYEGKEYQMFLDKCSTTDIDLSYTFNFKVPKSLTIGLSIYNVFSAEYDNNGWAYCELNKDANGKIYAWSTDEFEAGFAPQAPINFLVHASIRF
jgi:iron complex outermembrane receptor protein